MTEMANDAIRDRGRVTISDLARQLGLSQSSVSAALNDAPGVGPSTRARVKQLAAELDWRPHAGARALRLRRSMTIGVLLERDPVQLAQEPFYSLVIGGIEEELQRADYSLMLRVTRSPKAQQVYERWHDERAVDGVILFDTEVTDPRVPLLERLELPHVVLGEGTASAGALRLTSDATEEANLIVDHLLGLGHRNFVHVTGPATLGHEVARLNAVETRLAAVGATVFSASAAYTVKAADAATQRLLREHPDTTAVVASSDLTAIGAYRAVHEVGLALPQQVSLVAWDDSLTGQTVTPSITSLDRDSLGMGRMAAEMLIRRLAGEPVETPCRGPRPRLVVRGTTGPAIR